VAPEDPRYKLMRKRLILARRESGLTQTEVAARFQRPQSFIAKVESGERHIDPIELLKFSEIYGQDLMWFLSDSTEDVGSDSGG
jgi:transcriptional regulator with XRE-family HTH domain